MSQMRQRIPGSPGTPIFASQTVQMALLAVITLLWSFPLWYTAGKTGSLDWGFTQNQWEVRWKTVFEYHQWPAHNPWQGGGIPVNPVPGYLSVQALTTLLMGLKAGISAYIVFYLLLGAWGFHKLGRLLFKDDAPAALFLAIIGPASPALAFHLTAGHLNFVTLMAWPVIFFYLLSCENDRWGGLKAGLFIGLVFNETPFYITLYGGCLFAIGFTVKWIAGITAERRSMLRFAAILTCTVLPLILPIVLSVLMVAADYSRVANTSASIPVSLLWAAYFQPVTAMKSLAFHPEKMVWWGNWEIYSYLGWGACSFWLAGLVARPRWFHGAMLGTFLFTIGNQHWWEPMHWLMQIPPFSSHQSFNRLRLFTCLFFAVGAAWGVHRLLVQYPSRSWARRGVLLLCGAAAAEIMLTSHLIARNSHFAYQLPPVINERQGEFYQRSERHPLPDIFDGWPADLPLYTQANIGIVSESAAIPSQFRQTSTVQTIDSAGYIGEFTQNGKRVKPDYWSPNLITFEHLDPNVSLLINLNRGYPWRNFGRPLFPTDRIVEFGKPFIVQPDAQGRINLTYILPVQRLARWCALAALGLAVCFCLYLLRRQDNHKYKC